MTKGLAFLNAKVFCFFIVVILNSFLGINVNTIKIISSSIPVLK